MCHSLVARAQWTHVTGPYRTAITCFATNGATVYGGTYGGVYVSTDTGHTWTLNTGVQNFTVRSMVFLNGALLAGTDSGLFATTNSANLCAISSKHFWSSTGGHPWQLLEQTPAPQYRFQYVTMGSSLYAFTFYSGVLKHILP